MSYDPVHDWLDAAFRKLGGDKKAFTRMKKRNARTREFRNSHHGDGDVFLGREGVSELDRRLNGRQRPFVDPGMMLSQNPNGFPSGYPNPYPGIQQNTSQFDPGMILSQNPYAFPPRCPDPYSQGPRIPQNNPQFDPRMDPRQNTNGFPCGYPPKYGPMQGGQGLLGQRFQGNPSFGAPQSRVNFGAVSAPYSRVSLHRGSQMSGNGVSTPASSIRSGMHASKMLVGNMNRTYLEGYEIPTEVHRV